MCNFESFLGLSNLKTNKPIEIKTDFFSTFIKVHEDKSFHIHQIIR